MPEQKKSLIRYPKQAEWRWILNSAFNTRQCTGRKLHRHPRLTITKGIFQRTSECRREPESGVKLGMAEDEHNLANRRASGGSQAALAGTFLLGSLAPEN